MNEPNRFPVRVTVWGENVHDGTDDAVRELYPDGMHTTIAYRHPDVMRVLANAVEWAAPRGPHGGAPDSPSAPRDWFVRSVR